MRCAKQVTFVAVVSTFCLSGFFPGGLRAQGDRGDGDRGYRGGESRGDSDRFRGGPPFGGDRGGPPFGGDRGGPSFGGDRGGPPFGGFRGGDSGSGGGFRGGPPDGGGFRGGPPSGGSSGGPSDFYRRMDANGNGLLEPSEVPERMRGFMESRLGIDLSRPVSIRQLEERSSREGDSRSGSSSSRSSSSTATTSSPAPTVEGGVPGFGAATTEELAMVASFGNGSELPTTPLEKRYDSRVIERMNEALSRYDRNKDGYIDSTEWREWRSSSDPRSFDKNGDGRLNKEEVAARYASYSSSSSGSSRSSGSSSGSSSRSSDSDRRSDDRSRGGPSFGGPGGGGPGFGGPSFNRDGRDGRSDSRSGDGRPSFGGFSRGGDSSSSGSSEERMGTMAGMIMERLDQNRNGMLDGDELKGMRSDPKSVDKNGDGKITKEELAASLGSRSFGGPPGGGPPGGGPPGGGSFSRGSDDGRSRFFGGPPGGSYSRDGSSGSRGEEGSRGSRDGSSRDSRSADSSRRGSRTATEEKPKSYRLQTTAERVARQQESLPDWFGRKDINGDGQVSMAEYASVWSESSAYEFARADRNDDGTVTVSEAIAGPRTLAEPSPSYTSAYSSGSGDASSSTSTSSAADSGDKYAKQSKMILGQLDRNKDSAIDSEEWAAKTWTKAYGDYAALDGNADGKLDESEIAAGLKAKGK